MQSCCIGILNKFTLREREKQIPKCTVIPFEALQVFWHAVLIFLWIENILFLAKRNIQKKCLTTFIQMYWHICMIHNPDLETTIAKWQCRIESIQCNEQKKKDSSMSGFIYTHVNGMASMLIGKKDIQYQSFFPWHHICGCRKIYIQSINIFMSYIDTTPHKLFPVDY